MRHLNCPTTVLSEDRWIPERCGSKDTFEIIYVFMWPDVSHCFVIFHDFLRRIGSLMRPAVSWSPRRRIAALVFSGKPRPSSVCFSIVHPTWILQPTPNQHRQQDQVLSSFISKELRSPQQEPPHSWSHHRALHPKHPVTFRWNMVRHSVIELHAKL